MYNNSKKPVLPFFYDYILPNKAGVNQKVFVVCDGVGGLKYGDIASKLLSESVFHFLLILIYLYLDSFFPLQDHQNHQSDVNKRDECQIQSLCLYDDEVRSEGCHPSWKRSNGLEGFPSRWPNGQKQSQ